MLDGTPWPAPRAARLAEQVALGIAEAHRQGIVHRDLKPSNVLLAAEGTPKVSDFGLAKMLDSKSAITRSESVMGSPSYMAPEQALGRSKEAAPAGDVYAVGAILYELLTGRPPFRGTTALETLEQVKTTEPVPPSRLVPGMPRDIETIVLKCLQKEPGKRYASALTLAEDLRRFQEGQPITARRSTSAERFRRWCRRNPGLAGANITAATLTTILAIGATMAAWKFRDQVNQISRDRLDIQVADRKTRENLFESLTSQAQARRFSRRVGQRFESLDALEQAARIARELELPPERFELLRDEAIACLALPDMRKSGRVIDRPPGVLLVAFDPTMTRYALRFRDGTVQVKNVHDDQEVARFQARGDREIFVFCFSPVGRYLATTHFPGFALTVWDVDRRAVTLNDPGPISFEAFKFSPDSRRIALCHEDGALLVCELATGRPSRRWSLPTAGDLEFRGDGAQIAVTYKDLKNAACRILEVDTGRVVRSLPLPISWRARVVWSPDGTTLATACDDAKVYLWDAVTGTAKARFEGSTNAGLHATFHPSGTLLASNGWENRLRLWDAILGRPVLSFSGSDIERSGFSQDGQIVVSLEDKLTTFEVDPAFEYRTFAHASDPPVSLEGASIRRDGRLMAVGTNRGVVLWDLANGRELAFLPIGNAWRLMFEASGDLLTSGDAGVWRWPVRLDPARGEFRIGPPTQLPLPARHGGIAEDRSARIVALANFRNVRVLTPERTFSIGPLDDCRYVAVSPDGQWLATGSHIRGAQVWRVRDAARMKELPIDDGTRVTFSPDGKWLMTTSAPCRLWAVGTWLEALEIGGQGHCFTPDGRMLVVIDATRVIRLVETETGRTVARLESPDLCEVTRASFGPDGSRLVVTTPQGSAVHVWDLRAIRRRLAAMGLDLHAPACADADPADATSARLPPLQVNLGPLAGENSKTSPNLPGP